MDVHQISFSYGTKSSSYTKQVDEDIYEKKLCNYQHF